MIVIICVDDDMGIMFNKRRQSQDRVLRERIISMASGKKLWLNCYSEKQFEQEYLSCITATDKFLDEAAKGDYCFVENDDILPYERSIEKIILFRWNRRYPSDLKFSYPLAVNGWKLISATNFAGSSHEKITEEVYVR